MPTDLIVATPAFLDLTVVGLDALPALGEERFAGDLVRSPGGGAITAVAAARLGLSTALVAPLGDDLPGEYVRAELEQEGVQVSRPRTSKTPQTLVLPCGEDRAMVTVDPGAARARGRRRGVPAEPRRSPATSSRSTSCPRARAATSPAATTTRTRSPAGSRRRSAAPRVLFLDRADALLLTGTETLDDAVAALGGCRARPRSSRSARSGTVAMTGGERIDTPAYDTGPGRRHDRRPRPALRRLRLGRPARRRAARVHRLGAALRRRWR